MNALFCQILNSLSFKMVVTEIRIVELPAESNHTDPFYRTKKIHHPIC